MNPVVKKMESLHHLSKKELLDLLVSKTEEYLKLMNSVHTREEIQAIAAELTYITNEISERKRAEY